MDLGRRQLDALGLIHQRILPAARNATGSGVNGAAFVSALRLIFDLKLWLIHMLPWTFHLPLPAPGTGFLLDHSPVGGFASPDYPAHPEVRSKA